MHNSNARLWVLGATALAALAGLLIAISLIAIGGSGAALANTTPPPFASATATTGPAQPTKIPATGDLSGTVDILVTGPIAGAPGLLPNKRAGLFHCIAQLTHDSSGGPGLQPETVAAQCVADQNIGDQNSQLNGRNVPGEGSDARPGPPPPPPYVTGKPAKGTGTYNTATDVSVTTTCFPSIGGGLGPNIISVLTINSAKAQLAATGKQTGIVLLYGAASNNQCRTLTVTGLPSLTLWTKVNYIGASANSNCAPNCVPLPWRTDGDADYDNDTCTDAQELAKPSPGAQCGDDPWNPFDSEVGSGNPNAGAADYSGAYYMLATDRPADTCQAGSWDGQGGGLYDCTNSPEVSCADALDNDGDGWVNDGCVAVGTAETGAQCTDAIDANSLDTALVGLEDDDGDAVHDEPVDDGDGGKVNDGCLSAPGDDTYVPGAYYHCYSYITDAAGKLTADILCYIDFGPNTTAFPIRGTATGNGTTLAVNLTQCAGCTGDGKPGAAPAGPSLSSAANPPLFADIDTKQTHLSGVAAGNDMRLWGCFQDLNGHHSAHHWMYVDILVDRYTWQGSMRLWKNQVNTDCQNGTPAGAPTVNEFELVKQGADPNRDTDLDGCADKIELSDDQITGGLRDPSNPWDYFNPANNTINRTGDITAVVQHYGLDDPPNPQLGYDKKYDRSGQIPGSNRWNLRPPDGQIRTGDITSAVNSYGQDCGAANTKATPTAVPTRTPWVKATPVDYVTPTQSPTPTPP